ncbi:hypothetical protein [Nocardia sp. NPDC005998]|uniref:hypothetical protein n=1 Tax=Nocardia sp. NPDC005998 TaxID=3156894 RepID=UPI0033B16FAB
MHLTQTLHRAVQQNPERVLTVDGERTRTVAESAARIARLAGGLHSLGVTAGGRVPRIPTGIWSACSRCPGRTASSCR